MEKYCEDFQAIYFNAAVYEDRVTNIFRTYELNL